MQKLYYTFCIGIKSFINKKQWVRKEKKIMFTVRLHNVIQDTLYRCHKVSGCPLKSKRILFATFWLGFCLDCVWETLCDMYITGFSLCLKNKYGIIHWWTWSLRIEKTHKIPVFLFLSSHCGKVIEICFSQLSTCLPIGNCFAGS